MILAAVAINLTVGNNGLFTRASDVARVHKYNKDMEMINLALEVVNIDIQTGNYPNDRDIFLEELQKTDENAEVDYSNDEEIIVYYNEDYYAVDPITMKVSKYGDETTSVYVARIGNTEYKTIQEAFDAVQKNNVETEVVILKNITKVQQGNVENGKNIVLNMNNFGGLIDLENQGKLKISNGIISGDRDGGGNITNDGELTIENMQELSRYIISNNGTININTVKEGWGSLYNTGIANITGFETSYEDTYNAFTNTETMNITNCNMNSFYVTNRKDLTIKNSTLTGKSQEGVIINEGKCEVKENTSIISKYSSFGVDYGVITNRENAEFIMNGGNVSGGKFLENKGIARLSGELQCISNGMFGGDNEATGELYIEDNVYIKSSILVT